MNTQTFSTLKDLLTTSREIFTNGTTFEQYKNFSSYLLDNEPIIKGIISKETIVSLSRFCWHKDKKEKMVSSVYSTLCQNLTLSDSFQYSPFDETFSQAIRRVLNTYTEDQYFKYKEVLRLKAEAKEKALNNPETLDEFRTFISRKGEAALNEEQRIKYDELTADTRKAVKLRQEEKQAEIKAVENVNAEMVIKESFHAKKNIPLWVVVLSARVERDVYTDLNDNAKKLGGYYSSYRGNGAIPGFTFENKEAAELFTKLKEGNVNASEIKQEAKEERQQTRAEALREKGIKAQEEGEEELNRDRQDNTHRRAAMAANAERRASAKIEFGKKLQQIAAAMEAGEIKYLDKLTNGKDLEELESVLRQAKYSHCSKEKLKSDEYEINLSTVNYAKFPYPVIYASNSSEIMRMIDTPGKKQAAARMLRRLKGVESYTIEGAAALEDYETLYCTRCAVIDTWRIENYKEYLMKLKRIKRLGIDTIEELRAALRELLTLTKVATITEDQKRRQRVKELERKFIGLKIPGFFPTPEELANRIVELANIKEDETICEPSAGLGHLAEAITEAHPENDLTCIEYNSRLFDALELKGFKAVHEDFTQHTGRYDKIVMNPPFENLQDIDHVYHAFNLLNPGGRLVAIMANNKHRKPDFIDFINQFGYYEENESGAFLSAFNSTGVSTITVVIDKPKE